MGAKGDDCLVGPYRPALLRVGALRGLLRCALQAEDRECRAIVEQAAAVGVMYLSTMVGLGTDGLLAARYESSTCGECRCMQYVTCDFMYTYQLVHSICSIYCYRL